jgi:hypothetical protein
MRITLFIIVLILTGCGTPTEPNINNIQNADIIK